MNWNGISYKEIRFEYIGLMSGVLECRSHGNLVDYLCVCWVFFRRLTYLNGESFVPYSQQVSWPQWPVHILTLCFATSSFRFENCSVLCFTTVNFPYIEIP